MELSSEVFGAVVVIHAPKELNDEQADRVGRKLSTCDQACVVLDLDDAEAFDSVGLEMLLDTQESLRSRDGDLKLVASNPVNRKILEVTRLDHQLEVFESVIDAVRSFA